MRHAKTFLPVVGLGDSSDSVTIAIVSVTIMIVIAKNYYHASGLVVTGMCFWYYLTSTYPYLRDNKECFKWDQSWQRAGIDSDGGQWNSGVKEHIVFLPQM